MIINLPNTTTAEIARTLADARDNYSLATGRVLTFLVAAHEDGPDDIESILDTLRDTSSEHPARVLVLTLGEHTGPSRIDATVLVAADAGASEMAVMRIQGELAEHLDSVVTPLLLPDTPIVACWPADAPRHPADDPLGRIAQRRITNTRLGVEGPGTDGMAERYVPGDSDLMWSRITPWRGVVASALDRYPGHEVRSADIAGIAGDPSVDIAAGWLAESLGVQVTRRDHFAKEGFPIKDLVLHCDGGDVEVTMQDAHTMRVSVPNRADLFMATQERSDAECLAEELRHLGPDTTFAAALRGMEKVVRA